MREIKFRAWHNFAKEMLYMEKHTKLTFYWDSNGWLMDEGITRAISTEVGILMQYTGLKDKNGKEIYEADYLNVWLDGLGNEIFEVRWDLRKARFILVDKLGDTWSFDDSNDIEVIGNIHEAPELRKVKV